MWFILHSLHYYRNQNKKWHFSWRIDEISLCWIYYKRHFHQRMLGLNSNAIPTGINGLAETSMGRWSIHGDAMHIHIKMQKKNYISFRVFTSAILCHGLVIVSLMFCHWFHCVLYLVSDSRIASGVSKE